MTGKIEKKRCLKTDDLRSVPVQHQIVDKNLNKENKFDSYFKIDLGNMKVSEIKEIKKEFITEQKKLSVEEKILENINNRLGGPVLKNENIKEDKENSEVIEKKDDSVKIENIPKKVNFNIDSSVFKSFLNKIRKAVPNELIPKPKPQPTLKEFYEHSKKIKKNPDLVSNFLEMPKFLTEFKKKKKEKKI